mmetsp:Transcript_1590/g.3293  ORF Transcript_1590/g.3293 Transcript_1590/m.3293 type:complete len:133 (-) Transcript_1590:970-1368(-)
MPIQVASTDHTIIRRSPRHTPPTPPAAVDAASSPLRRSPRLAANNAARNAANDDAHNATQSSTAAVATSCTTRCSAACASAAAAGDLRYSGVRKNSSGMNTVMGAVLLATWMRMSTTRESGRREQMLLHLFS